MPAERRRHRLRRGLAFAALALVVLLVAARLALTPFVASRLRDSLAHMNGMRGNFSDLELSVVHLSGVLRDLRIEKLSAEGQRTPFVQVSRTEVGLYWSALVRGHLVGAAELDHPKISLVSSEKPRESQGIKEAPQIGRKLQEIVPLRLDRFEVKNGEVLWIDARVPERPRLWLHGVAATLENFATRSALARGEPSVLALSGTLQRTGKVSVFASADPLAKGLTFAGQARMERLELPELGELLRATAEIVPRHGTLDISARFQSIDGRITGGVRPVLKNPQVQQAKPGFGAALKALLADVALDLFSDRVPARNAVAATIPIHGEVQDPNAQVWPTVLSIVRNAFVAGITDSLTHLPPQGGGDQPAGGPPRAGQARRGSEGGHPSGGRSGAGGKP